MDSEHHQAEAEARFEAQLAEMRRPFQLMTWPDGHISLTEGGSGTGFPIGHDPDFARELHEWLNYVVEHREAADEIASLRARVEAYREALSDTQSTMSAVKAEAVVDGGGTCLWIAERLNEQMVANAALNDTPVE